MAGSFYDELHVGQMLTHAIRRTVTEAGSNWFSALTHNPAALRLDKEYCRTKTEFEQHVVNSCFTLGLMVGHLGQRQDAWHVDRLPRSG